jgi:hypothetical protein
MSGSSGQEITRVLWNMKVRYQVQNSPQMVHAVSQLSPIVLYKISFTIYSNLLVHFPCGPFLPEFAMKIFV